MTATGPIVVMPDRLDAGAKVLDGQSTEALMLYLRVAGVNEGVEMPPAIRSKVAEAVAAAASVLLRLSNGFHGLANYLRLRADGARRVDTDDLSDDLFAELLHDGPSLRLLRIQEPLELERHRYESLDKALKPVEFKADAAANAAEGKRRQIEALERRLARTSDPGERSRLAQRIAVIERQAGNADVVAKVSRTFGWPAQALSAATEIADGKNPARVAGEAGLVALATRLAVRAAPGASGGPGGVAVGVVASVAAESAISELELGSDERAYRSGDELLDDIEQRLDRTRRTVLGPVPRPAGNEAAH